jgi:lysine 6-dehydrogenase
VKFLVIGAGLLGYAVVYDLIRSPKVDKIMLADSDEGKVAEIMMHFADDRIIPCKLDLGKLEETATLMTGADVVISCLEGHYNYELSKAALEATKSLVDFGGDRETIRRQFLLNDLAVEKKITIMPNCGLVPSMVSILATSAAESMDELYEIKIRAGGIPVEELTPLNYSLTGPANAIIDESTIDTTVVRDGKILRLPSLTEVETISFPYPFKEMEAFNSYAGITTLFNEFSGRVQHLDFKTVSYPGYCAQMSLLKELGLMNDETIKLDGAKVSARSLLNHLFETKLPRNEPDVVLVRVVVSGERKGRPAQVIWECVDYMDQAAGIPAMIRMKAFPASIIAQLIARGDIDTCGTIGSESSVPRKLFLAEIASRGIVLNMTDASAMEVHENISTS